MGSIYVTYGRVARLLAFTGALAGLAACQSSNEEECLIEVASAVSQIASTKTGQVGTPLEVYYTLQINNGCGEFKNLVEERRNNNIYLTPIVKYQGCSCPEVATDYNGIYTFTPTQAGKYVVHFRKTDNSLITDTLTVQ